MRFKNWLLIAFVTMELTAYTLSCGNGDGVTASGTMPIAGRTVAADHLPFGTIVEIFGKTYVVEDRFGAGHTNKIDIFMDNYEDAINFGRRIAVVKVYAE